MHKEAPGRLLYRFSYYQNTEGIKISKCQTLFLPSQIFISFKIFWHWTTFCKRGALYNVHWLYFFRQITTFIKVRAAFVFGLQTLELKDFPKVFQLKHLKPKNKGRTDFYEYCDLTKKVYLMYMYISTYLCTYLILNT